MASSLFNILEAMHMLPPCPVNDDILWILAVAEDKSLAEICKGLAQIAGRKHSYPEMLVQHWLDKAKVEVRPRGLEPLVPWPTRRKDEVVNTGGSVPLIVPWPEPLSQQGSNVPTPEPDYTMDSKTTRIRYVKKYSQ